MGITEQVIEIAVKVIDATGYLGVMIMMIGESMLTPIPSEAVMPFAGFLIADGKMSWIGVIVFSTLGSIIGSGISYYIGRYLGQPFITRFGKYFLLNEEHLHWSEQFFAKYGQGAIFVSRFVPVVRHFISIPAGTAKMPFGKFMAYTAAGAAGWNTILTFVGFKLGEHWDTVKSYTHYLDIIVVAVLLLAAAYFVYSQLQKRRG